MHNTDPSETVSRAVRSHIKAKGKASRAQVGWLTSCVTYLRISAGASTLLMLLLLLLLLRSVCGRGGGAAGQKGSSHEDAQTFCQDNAVSSIRDHIAI